MYILTSDKDGKPACTGACLSHWPPVIGSGKAGRGVDGKGFATITRGSSTQVTYRGHPLYEYAGDSASGDANGDGIKAFGGTWLVAKSSDDGSGGDSWAAAPSTSSGKGGGYGYP